MIAWIELVQNHPDYSDNLEQYVDGAMSDDEFIDAVSDMLDSRREDVRKSLRANFRVAIDAVGAREM